MAAINKKSNEYAAQFGRLYGRTPKAVFAAVAFSYGVMRADDTTGGVDKFLEEWRILHENGIVPQRPPGKGKA